MDFITESPQIVVNNPKIRSLENQQEWPDVASLYIAMVNGETPIGNGWRIDPASAAPGIYIRRCGGKTEKRLIR